MTTVPAEVPIATCKAFLEPAGSGLGDTHGDRRGRGGAGHDRRRSRCEGRRPRSRQAARAGRCRCGLAGAGTSAGPAAPATPRAPRALGGCRDDPTAATESTPSTGPATVGRSHPDPTETQSWPSSTLWIGLARGQGRRPAAARGPPAQCRTTLSRGTPRGEREPARRLHRAIPGTGKTTVARIIARLYGSIGLVSRGHLVEVSRADLVAGYVGQTALKVQAVVDRSVGGVPVHRRGLFAGPGRRRRIRGRGDRDAGQADGGSPRRPCGHRRRLPG